MGSKSSLHLGPISVVQSNEQKVKHAHELLDALISMAIRGKGDGALSVRIPYHGGRLGKVRQIMELDNTPGGE